MTRPERRQGPKDKRVCNLWERPTVGRWPLGTLKVRRSQRRRGSRGPAYLSQQVLGFPPQSVRQLPAARGQVEDGRGRHVRRLHVVGVVEAALTAGAAGAAPSTSSCAASSSSSSSAAQAAAAGSVAAGGAAGGARRLTVAFSCGGAGGAKALVENGCGLSCCSFNKQLIFLHLLS